MRRTYLCLRCICALSLATGIALISPHPAHSAKTLPDQFCWTNSAGFTCMSLGNAQCGGQQVVGAGCAYCDGTAGLFTKTCVACTGCVGCISNLNSVNCGNQWNGTCSKSLTGSWSCGGYMATIHTCSSVYECQ